jgi:predicted PurR-regulated permease PerM
MSIPNERIADRLAYKLVAYTLLAVIFVWVVVELKALIINLLVALILASALAPIADMGEKKKIPRALTVAVVYILVGLVYVLLAMTLAPAINEQGSTLIRNLPSYIDKLQSWSQSAAHFAGTGVPTVDPSKFNVQELGTQLARKTMDFSTGLIGVFMNVLLLMFLSAYFVVEARPISAALLRWLPPDVRAKWSPHLGPLSNRMGGYVRGQILTATAVATFFAVAFSLIGLEYGLALAALSGLLNLVPYVGSFIAVALALVVAINQNPTLALLVLGAFAIEQWLESTILVPFLLGRSVELHPLVVLLCMIAGATLFGVVGAIIAIPVTSSALYIAEQFYLKPREEAASAAVDPAG